jgi:hypothetical protein
MEANIKTPVVKPPNANQLLKINNLQQKKINFNEDIYNLELIFNKIKAIGNTVQTIRNEKSGIINGIKLWNLINEILSDEDLNSDLYLEIQNYEFNIKLFDTFEKRLNTIKIINNDAYPDYYMNNIIKLYYQNQKNINMISIMHMALDIGQLEVLILKYLYKPIIPCYSSVKFDKQIFSKLILLIRTIGRSFIKIFPNDIPENKKFFGNMIVKHIQNLFLTFGNDLINYVLKYTIDFDNLDLFFDITMDEDLHNANDFNLYADENLHDRAYKIIYKYLRDDFNDNINEYQLSITYQLLYFMLDLYNTTKLSLDKIIEFSFYTGQFLELLNNNTDSTTFINIIKSFDDDSIIKLFDVENYLMNNSHNSNKQIFTLLDDFHNKINNMNFKKTKEKLLIIPEHIKYMPIEITQLFCILQPKQISNLDNLTNLLNELNSQLLNSNDTLFNTLLESIDLTNLPAITSILTSDNDLKILGIDYDDNDEEITQIDNPQIDNPQIDNPQIDNPQINNPQINNPQINNPQIDNTQIDNEEENYKKKYIKYKNKYIQMKNRIKRKD